MKINVEFDLTPDEFRQAWVFCRTLKRSSRTCLRTFSGKWSPVVEGYDPHELMRPYLQQPMTAAGTITGVVQLRHLSADDCWNMLKQAPR